MMQLTGTARHPDTNISLNPYLGKLQLDNSLNEKVIN